MGQRSVRFPDELVARADEWCRANDRPFSYAAVKALEQFLGPVEGVVVRAQAGEFERGAVKRAIELEVSSGEGECPHGRCKLSGPLGERCPTHPHMRFKAKGL